MALTKTVSADNQTYTEVLCWYVYHILCEMGNLANLRGKGKVLNAG